MLSKDKKKELIDSLKTHEKDTGSPEVQVALLSGRITALSDHLRSNKGDNNSKRGLLKLVGQRRRLLNYLKRISQNRYEKTLKSLGLRK